VVGIIAAWAVGKVLDKLAGDSQGNTLPQGGALNDIGKCLNAGGKFSFDKAAGAYKCTPA